MEIFNFENWNPETFIYTGKEVSKETKFTNHYYKSFKLIELTKLKGHPHPESLINALNHSKFQNPFDQMNTI
jgi:hypothetical protein